MSMDLIIGIIGLALAVIFGIIGIIQTRRASTKKEPKYSITTEQIIASSKNIIPGLEIRFNGETLDSFSISKIAFWNNGRLAIRKTDFPINQRFEIKNMGSGFFYDVRVIYNANPSNNFSISHSFLSNSASVNFDYLDHNRGVVIQVMHNEVDPHNIQMIGEIIDSDPIKRERRPIVLPHFMANSLFLASVMTLWITFYLSMKFILIKWIPSSEAIINSLDFAPGFPTLGYIATFIYWGLTICLIYILIIIIRNRRKIPGDLRKVILKIDNSTPEEKTKKSFWKNRPTNNS